MQVRDAASTAYAKAVLAFPGACKPALPEVWPLWFGLLDENVFSVREHAAAALCDVVRAYGQEALELVLPVLRYGSSPAHCDHHCCRITTAKPTVHLYIPLSSSTQFVTAVRISSKLEFAKAPAAFQRILVMLCVLWTASPRTLKCRQGHSATAHN